MNDPTQQAANARHGADNQFPFHLYFVQLPDNPGVRLNARDEAEAISRYNALCGVVRITNPFTRHSVQLVEERQPPETEAAPTVV